ncbi:MAG: PmoA family protein [Verrucomicrobia subdivision 3 bacterium]|nr:PmoA family protein [Limisphaerales bacterium]
MKALLICMCGALSAAVAQSATVTVAAGEHDRRNTVVTFAFRDARPGNAILRGENRTYDLQISGDGTAAFVLDELPKGKQLKLEVVPGGAGGRMTATHDGKKVKIGQSTSTQQASPARPWLEYQAQPSELPREDVKAIFQRGAYLHPIRTLSGRVITDDYPANHAHHHGLWWAWTKTEFDGREPDFWNMGAGKGKVDFVAIPKTWNGPVHAGFVSRHKFVDLTTGQPMTALNETWEVRAYGNANQGGWIFDLTSIQECAGPHPLKLPEYHYGGLGFRGHWDWNGKTNTFFLTSEGETDRVKGHGTRARWCDISGFVEGEQAGITILCHPDNFRAPQHMRLHPSEPFFCYTPQQGGNMEIAPGQKYTSRYRFIVHDGPPDKDRNDRIWSDYAHPPVVRVGQ